MRPIFRMLRKQRTLSEVFRAHRPLKYWGPIFFSLLCVVIPLHGQDDLVLQASELMRAGKFHAAELLWRQLEQRHPKNSSVHSNLGLVLAQQGELAPATTEYRKSLALKPHQPEVAFNLGIAEFKQGHFSAAIPAFELLAKEKPEDPRSALLLGMSHFGLHQYANAIPYLQKALQNDPSNLELHNVLAQSCLWSCQYECALAEFKSISPIPLLVCSAAIGSVAETHPVTPVAKKARFPGGIGEG